MVNRQQVLITGGSSGIGLALADTFLQRGYDVMITGRDLHKLKQASEAYPGLFSIQSDVSRDEDVTSLVSLIQERGLGLDVLINNAGIMNLVDSADETHDLNLQLEEIAINFQSPVRLLHHFLPLLKQSKNAVLINVSSGLAYVPYAQAPVYSGTKAALHAWTQSVRQHVKPHHIRVVELMPPVVATSLADQAQLTGDSVLKPMSPTKLAEIFWREYTKGTEEILPGISRPLKVMSRLAPRFLFKQLNKNPIPERRIG